MSRRKRFMLVSLVATLGLSVAAVAIIVPHRHRTDIQALVHSARAGQISAVMFDSSQRRVMILDPNPIKYLFSRGRELKKVPLAEPKAPLVNSSFYGEYQARWIARLSLYQDRMYLGRLYPLDIGRNGLEQGVPAYAIPLSEPIPEWVREMNRFVFERSFVDESADENKYNTLRISAGGKIEWEWHEDLVPK